MTLWIILTTMCCVAAVLVAVPLIRRYEQRAPSDGGSLIYADQLKEVSQDAAAGLIGEADAQLARLEIQRRLLANERTANVSRPVSPAWRTVALAAVAGLVVLGSVNLYALNGRPDLPSAAPGGDAVAELSAASSRMAAQALPEKSTPAGVDTMIDKLAARLAANPGDAEGWRMLGWSYFNTQRYDEAAKAYAKASQLAPENVDYRSAYAEALVQAAQGIVTPAAQVIFAKILEQTPKDFRARFYAALTREQAGDLGPALDQWTALFDDAPKDAGWLVDVKARIAELGKSTGRDVSRYLAVSIDPATDQTGGLAAGDQQASVDGMIAGLAARLGASPRDRDGWAMMIRSLKVKGDSAGAQAALARAMTIFADEPATRTQIEALAKSLGVKSTDGLAGSAPRVSQEDVAAITAMPAGDQQAMIEGMVKGLAEKLAKAPHDADGWIRLIRSRVVLKQPDLARQALRQALAEFAGDTQASDQIAAAARDLGQTLD